MKNNTTDTQRGSENGHRAPDAALGEREPRTEPAGRLGRETNPTGWPAALSDRAVYPTAIGPVCMSRAEHESYLEELKRRGVDPAGYERPIAR